MRFIFLITVLITVVFLSGCITPQLPECGDGSCVEGIEDNSNSPYYCSQDCGPPPGDLEVEVHSSFIGGSRLSGAVVAVTGNDFNAVADTNKDGIALFNSVPPGTYYITASKEGYYSKDANAEVISGQTTRVRIKLPLHIVIPGWNCGDGNCTSPEDANNCPADCGPIVTFDEISIGNNAIEYSDVNGVERSIPFYIRLANTSMESTFTVGNQTFYYRCSTTDQNLEIRNNDYLNGKQIRLRETRTRHVEMLTDSGWLDLLGTDAPSVVYLNGMQYSLEAATITPLAVYLLADGNCEFSSQPFTNADHLELGGAEYYTTIAGNVVTKTIYYDDDTEARVPLGIPLYVTNDTMTDTYKYRLFAETRGSDGDIYLVLDTSKYQDGLLDWRIELGNIEVASRFTVAGQTFYYKCDQMDQIINVSDGDFFNGYLIEIESGSIITDKGVVPITVGSTLYLGGAQFEVYTYSDGIVGLAVDGSCQFGIYSSLSGDYLKINGRSYLNNTIYYDDDDPARGPLSLPLDITSYGMMDTYKYRLFVNGPRDGDIYLVLDADGYQDGRLGWKTKSGARVWFAGTDLDEDPTLGGIEADYFKPDIEGFGENAGDASFLTAIFYINEDGITNTIVPFINTALGEVISLPNDQLSFYDACVYFDSCVHDFECATTDRINCYAGDYSATTAYGSKISIEDGVATISVPVE